RLEPQPPPPLRPSPQRSDDRAPSAAPRTAGRGSRLQVTARSCDNLFKRRADAARSMAATDVHQWRRGLFAALTHERTARRKTAPGRKLGHARHHALDCGELFGLGIEARDGAEK